MSNEISVPGAMFSITYYFTCARGHIHPVEVKFQAMKPEGLTVEAITELRDSIIEATSHKAMRPSTQDEIDRYIVAETEGGETDPTSNGQYFPAPGVPEAQ